MPFDRRARASARRHAASEPGNPSANVPSLVRSERNDDLDLCFPAEPEIPAALAMKNNGGPRRFLWMISGGEVVLGAPEPVWPRSARSARDSLSRRPRPHKRHKREPSFNSET